ncbi:MAG TPA: dihydroneopterin aldolase [Chitinophagaceae bacterium]
MAGLITVELKHLRFFAYHGLFAEERKTGNEFEVNLAVSVEPDETVITQLNRSIDYAKLYALVKEEMKQRRDLLETFVMELAEKINSSFPKIKKVEIGIAKLHPPIVEFTGQVSVRYCKDF